MINREVPGGDSSDNLAITGRILAVDEGVCELQAGVGAVGLKIDAGLTTDVEPGAYILCGMLVV